MRDALFLPLNEEEELVITVDNVGAIGQKERDDVFASYEEVAYFSLRVAMMEMLSVGAVPFSAAIANFNGENAWLLYERGLKRVCGELGIKDVRLVGSSETNFSLLQSAVGFTLIGKVRAAEKRIGRTPKDAGIAVIGYPRVGPEVLEHPNDILPLPLFRKLLEEEGVYELIPVGSKGIRHELAVLGQVNGRQLSDGEHLLDLDKSAGPSTCILISYNKERESVLRDGCGRLFFPFIA
jgi:hypothetical protein